MLRNIRLLPTMLTAALVAAGLWFMSDRPLDANDPLSSQKVPSTTLEQPDIPTGSGSSDIEPEPGLPAKPATHSWHDLLQNTDDMAVFIKQASAAADSGDGDAAWIVFEAALICRMALRKIAAGDEAVREYLAPTLMTHLDEQRARDLQRCRPLLEDDYFNDWRNHEVLTIHPPHWRERALSLGSPMAKLTVTQSLLSQLADPATTLDREATTHTVRGYIRDVIRSDDARARFQLGLRLMSGDASRDGRYRMAMSLAACDMGYDCSADNPANPWANCRYLPDQCPPDTSYRSGLAESLSARDYARVDALAEQFKEAHRRGLYEELEPFMALDGQAFSHRSSTRP